MTRLPLALTLIAFLIAVSALGGGHVGTSVQCINDACFAAASSSLLSIVFGLGAFFALAYLPRKTVRATNAAPGLLRKFVAAFLDMAVALLGFGAVLATPMLIAEYVYTGSFEWVFSRNYLRPTDWGLTLFGVFATFAVILAMRLRSTMTGRPSFGQYVMGYLVQSERGKIDLTGATKRVAWTALYLAVWPVYAIYKLIKKPTKDSWDARCDTRSAKITYG